jgi:L-ascorbate metabolism protein UlaG (beta-lactamase superfamily)
MRFAAIVVVIAALAALGAACRGQTAGDGSASSGASSPASPAASPPSGAMTPDTSSGGVTIRYEGNAQVELSAGGGARVLIDVWSPDALAAPATSEDVLLTTHTHDDHLSPDFQAAFPGEQLFVREGSLDTSVAQISSVPAAHSQGDPIVAEDGSDYIFVIDMGGLRIVHFGDLGQDALTPAQLEALGEVDVAVMQFENSFSQMDLDNKKGFALMEQVKPKLIIQTHSSLEAVQEAAKRWLLLYSPNDSVTVAKADLPAETGLLLLGEDGTFYAGMVEVTEVAW